LEAFRSRGLALPRPKAYFLRVPKSGTSQLESQVGFSLQPNPLTSTVKENKMKASRFYVITGGTMVHVAPHFSLCAPAYGRVGYQIYNGLRKLLRSPEQIEWDKANEFEDLHELAEQRDTGPEPVGFEVVLVRTSMAGGNEPGLVDTVLKPAGINRLETNEDLEKLIEHLVLQPETKGIVMAAAVCDWQPELLLYKSNAAPDSGRREFGKREDEERSPLPAPHTG
jgi:hypothetical protein